MSGSRVEMPPATPAAAGRPAGALVRALRRLLRPLVRLLLANQVTYPFLANLLKAVYVEVADRDFAIADRPQTVSRLSLLTGIHRKDVKRLREAPPPDDAPPPNVSLGAQLVARWTGRPEFLDGEGRPRRLPRWRGRTGGPSFEELVASVSKDIRPRAVLDEWLRLGVVEIDAEDRVRLIVEAFVPEKGFDEKAFYFGRNLHDHIAAGAHNLAGRSPPLLERSVYYGELSAESADELAALAEQKGMDALRAVNRRALELREREASEAPRTLRINFGIYFYREPTAGGGSAGGADG
jgi:hypothetical protein